MPLRYSDHDSSAKDAPVKISPCSLIPSLRLALSSSPAKRRSRDLNHIICAALLALAAPLLAQQSPSLQEASALGQALFQQSNATGMVMVAVRGREVFIQGYGETYPGSRLAPDAHSEIRLCSLTKIFAGDLLTRLALTGKVGLADPLQRFAPPHVVVPDGPGLTPITLEDLALHTSGLPREVLPSPANTPHFTFPNQAQRWSWLPRQKLDHPPGSTALYSNVGFDLLGDALAKASGVSYAKLLHDTLLQPLGMWDATLVPTPDQCARLLKPAKDPGPCTQTLASGASSGLYATGTDVSSLLQYLLQIPGAPAQPKGALAIYRKPSELKSVQGLSHAGNPTGIGLGWVQLGEPDSPSRILQKTGGGAGFSTYIALIPSRQTGVFFAVTDGPGRWHIDFFQEVNNLLAQLANVPSLPPTRHPAAPPRRRPKPRRPTTSAHAPRRRRP